MPQATFSTVRASVIFFMVMPPSSFYPRQTCLSSSRLAYLVELHNSIASHKHRQLGIPTLNSSLALLQSVPLVFSISVNCTTIHLDAQMGNLGITPDASFLLTPHRIDQDWSSPPSMVGIHHHSLGSL